MANKTAFVDTHTFLHFKTIEDIDWVSLLGGATHVLLIVQQVVIRDLNRHKDSPTSAKLRKRAATALRKLEEFSNRSRPCQIRDSVDLEFRTKEPQIDFAAYSLSRDLGDDQLLASVIEFRLETGRDDVTIVTNDLGLKLKARSHSVTVCQLPENTKLPEEETSEEKRIREQEKKLREYESRVPQLKLTFGDGEKYTRVQVRPSGPIPENVVQERMAHVQSRYPKLEKHADDPSDPGIAFRQIGSEDIERYNAALDEFYRECKDHISKVWHYTYSKQSVLRLELLLTNWGASPAEDIDVFLHFPDGFSLLEDEPDYLVVPIEPKPPERPRSVVELLQTMREGMEAFKRGPLIPFIPGVMRGLAQSRNASAPSIKKLDSYEVRFTVERLKHRFTEQLDALYVAFESVDKMRSFSIDYTIHAANMPDEVAGELHVVIENAV